MLRPINRKVTSDRHQGAGPGQTGAQTESLLHEGIGSLPQGSCALLDLRYRNGKTGVALAREAGMPESVAYTLLARIHRLLERAVRKGSFDARGLPRPSADGEDWLEALGLRSMDGRAGAEEGVYLSVLLRRDARRRERIERLSRFDAELRSVLIAEPEITEFVEVPSPETAMVPVAAVPALQEQVSSIPPAPPVRDRSFLAIALGGIAVAGLSLWLVMAFSSRPMSVPSPAGVEMTAAPAVPAPLPATRVEILPDPAAQDRVLEAFRRLAVIYFTGGRCGTSVLSGF